MPLAIGVASVDITPPLGTPLVGYWFLRRASGVLDPLQAQALALSDGDSKAIILCLDVCFLPTDLADQAAHKIAFACGLPREAVFISCTHTHTGPALQPLMNAEEIASSYLETFLNRVVQAAESAMGNFTPVRAGLGASPVQHVAFNRRLLAQDGRVVTFKPDTFAAGMQPAGPVDSTLRLLCFYTSPGKPLAVLINFGLHPDTTGGTQISADYPGILRGALKRQLKNHPEVLFMNGPSGDINHLDPQWPREPYTRENAARIGEGLASAALVALRHPRWLQDAMIHFARRSLSLKIRRAAASRLGAAQTLVDEHRGEPTKEFVRARSLMDMSARSGETISAEVSALALGEATLVGLPGEVFTQIGMDIRANSCFPFTLISGLTNGYVGYIPTRQAFTQGGYETHLGRGSFLEVGAGEKLNFAARELLSDLHAG